MSELKEADQPVEFAVMAVRFRRPTAADYEAAVRFAAGQSETVSGELDRLREMLEWAFSDCAYLRNAWIRHFTLTGVSRDNSLRVMSDDVGLDPFALTVHAWGKGKLSAEVMLERFRFAADRVWTPHPTTFPYSYGKAFGVAGMTGSAALRFLGTQLTVMERRPSVRRTWSDMMRNAAALDRTLAEEAVLMTENRAAMTFGMPFHLIRYWNAEDRLRELAPPDVSASRRGMPSTGELASEALSVPVGSSESRPAWALIRACTEAGIQGSLADIAKTLLEEKKNPAFIRTLFTRAGEHFAAGFEEQKARYASDTVFKRFDCKAEPAAGPVLELNCDPAESLFW